MKVFPAIVALVLAFMFAQPFTAFLGSRVALAVGVDSGPSAEAFEAGKHYFKQGQFERALEAWAEAIQGFESKDDARAQSRGRLYIGAAYLALGRYPLAVKSFDAALDRAGAIGDRGLIAEAGASLGNAYSLLGREDEARDLLKKSIETAREIAKPRLAAVAGNNLGVLLASQRQLDDAVGVYASALEDARRAGDETLIAKTRVNMARALGDGGRSEAFEAELNAAAELVRALPASHEKAYALISVGRLYQTEVTNAHAGSSGLRAYDALSGAADTAEALGDHRALAYALGYLGELYENQKRYDEALQLTRRALQAAQHSNAPESLYRWQWQVGRLHRARGNLDAAVPAYQSAVRTLQSIRDDLTAGYGAARGSFRKQVEPIFLEFTDVLLQRAASGTDRAQAEEDLRQVRATVEILKGAELADYFQDDCVAALKSRTAGIDQVAPRTAALYPIVLSDRVELLVSLPDGMKQFTTRVSSAELTAQIRAFRSLLEKRITREYRTHAMQLYDWLIRPLEPELERQAIDTLVVVPDGALRTVPIAALHDGEDFLIARYAVATTPGLTLTDPHPIQRQDLQLLVIGLTESVQGFPALPNVAAEIGAIQAVYGVPKVLQDRDFRIGAVETELTGVPYSIVHVASHGRIDRDVRKSFLLTYDGKLNMDDLERFMGLTAFRKDPVELLTLSACQTAAGDDRAALGLAGIAVKAGARSALATLWFINDRASSTLVAEFYRQLQDPTLSKAKALRRAQLELIKDRRYRHPGFWSPFLLIGNWL